MKKTYPVLLVIGLLSTSLFANPYPDPNRVPRDPVGNDLPAWALPLNPSVVREAGLDVIRVEVAWTAASEKYEVVTAVVEKSGTETLLRRSGKKDALGSYRGVLKEAGTGKIVGFDAIGTGHEYRKLVRAFTFRFPMSRKPADFILSAENPKTGVVEEVLTERIDPKTLERADVREEVEVKLLKQAATKPALMVNIYSDGYTTARKDQFFAKAAKVVEALEKANFPGFTSFELKAVFSPSKEALGKAKDLGLPVKERDSFLGLYYPYWNPFGRWYNVVYPTREARYRSGIAQVPYDYPIVIMDNAEYWGVGNFNELTAIPAESSYFTYLLLHEFGHYFGLNEEYEGGGPTELAFSPGVDEPWSQNITFLRDKESLKWKQFVGADTPIPTPSSHWKEGAYGAYKGGYADTEPFGHSHKPGFGCVMTNGSKFCPICRHAIEQKVKFDLGN